VPSGWYHITTRGLGKRTIFKIDRDHEHFIELLGGMVERYSIILHAYVELDNHYLLIESPEGNVSQAMQWLNTSYSVWFNIKHDRVGALFQYRFKSIPVDNEGSWAFECAMYVHLNPACHGVVPLAGVDGLESGRSGWVRRTDQGRGVVCFQKIRNQNWF